MNALEKDNETTMIREDYFELYHKDHYDEGTKHIMIREDYEINLNGVLDIFEICRLQEQNDTYEATFILQYKSLRLMNVEIAKLSSNFGVKNVYARSLSTKKIIETLRTIPHDTREDWKLSITLSKDANDDFYINMWGEEIKLKKSVICYKSVD